MSVLYVPLLYLGVLLGLSAIRVPLAFSLLSAAIVCMLVAGRSLGSVAPTAFGAIDVFAFIAVPAYIYAGNIMLHGKVAASLLSLADVVAARIKGAHGAIAVILSMLFGTVSGSSVATVSMVGGMMIPEMNRLGYSSPQTTALMAATGVLGVLLPPSVPGIMYAISAGQSISAVWLVTCMPAFLLAFLWIAVALRMRLDPAKTSTLDAVLPLVGLRHNKTLRSLPALVAPLIIFGGIYGGFFTPTEAAAVLVAYALLIGWLFYRGINGKNFLYITLESAKASAAIMILLSLASIGARLFTFLGLPAQIGLVFEAADLSPWQFLLLLNICLILVGMFMETNTSIIVLTPLLLPIAQNMGVDPLHFGAIMLLNLELGMITPPFAANIFVACKVANLPYNKVLMPLIPYWLTGLFVLAITTAFPEFSRFALNLL